MKFPILFAVWIMCDIFLGAYAEMNQDEQTMSPEQLKEIPDCRSQVLPAGVQEWQSLQGSAITVEWSYGDNVSFSSSLLFMYNVMDLNKYLNVRCIYSVCLQSLHCKTNIVLLSYQFIHINLIIMFCTQNISRYTLKAFIRKITIINWD